jgi:CRISPR system Cascade subunit CasE
VYLSRIQLNPRRRDAWHLLGSPQRLHAAVLASFPAPPTGVQGSSPRVLWRLDEDGDRVFLYVSSPDEPDFAHLAEQAGWPTTERGLIRSSRALLDSLDAGQRWAFRLTANPTRYVRPEGADTYRRSGHVTVAQQEDWLLARAPGLGFSVTTQTQETVGGEPATIPDLAVTDRSISRFARSDRDDPRSRRTVTIAKAQFDGRLEVTDPDLLRQSLVTGIGPAKAYGCGLLTLARLGS